MVARARWALWPVLHVDEPGEGQVREQLGPALTLREQSEENAVRLEDVAALHQRQPVVEALLERAVERDGLLIRPVPLRRRDGLVRIALLATAAVVAGHLAEELVPRIEPRRHVPDRLRQRQVFEGRGQELRQAQARARAQQAVVVVDEAREAVVDALVVRHVRVRRVDADRLADDFGARPARPHEVVIDGAGADLVSRQDPLFELGVESAGLVHGVTPSGCLSAR